LNDLGENTKMAASLLVMAIVGGAVLTPAMGLLARYGIQVAYLVPIAGYLAEMAYVFWGCHVKPRRRG
jgi:FHS family L-fucose permease-like MFS transporter